MDVLVVSPGPRQDAAVAALRAAAEVYGWATTTDADDDAVRVEVVPGSCTRRPEALRVLERVRSTDVDLAASVAHVRTTGTGSQRG